MVNGAFTNVGIHQWKEKLVRMGADGASVNVGKKGRVVALLRRDIHHVIDFHCLPHQLEWALLEMQKSLFWSARCMTFSSSSEQLITTAPRARANFKALELNWESMF